MFHLKLWILLLIFSITSCSKPYVEIGCFLDRRSSAISGGWLNYPWWTVVRSCYNTAKQRGNSYFAVQHGFLWFYKCFTGRDAGKTYHKYGATSGCRNGRGGSSKNTVYWVMDDASSKIGHTLGEMDPVLEQRWVESLSICTRSGSCHGEYNNMHKDLSRLAQGMAAGEKLTTGISLALKEGKFSAVSAKLAVYAPFLGAMGPVVTIVAMFGNSPEVERLNYIVDLLNQGFKRIEQRFDEIEFRLDELEKTIKREHFWTRIRPRLEELSVYNQHVEDYFAAKSSRNRRSKKQSLIIYKKEAYETIIKLRNVFEGDYGSEELCRALIDMTNVDRRQVMNTIIDLYSRLIRGVSDYILILALREDVDLQERKDTMAKWVKELGNRVDQCDRDIESKIWLGQWMVDFGRVLGDTQKGMENHLVNRINSAFSTKYYWRDWLIVVYSDIYGKEHHWRHHCPDSYTYNGEHWKQRYNILVSSVSKTKQVNAFKFNNVHRVKADAKGLYNKLPSNARTCNYPIAGVVVHFIKRTQVMFALRAPTTRKYHQIWTAHRCSRGGMCYTFGYHVFVLG